MDNKIKSEIEELYEVGIIIKNSLSDKNQINYQVWYSKCLVLIKQLNPDRYDELASAKNLINKGYLRAAGAICGVVLESHFKSIMKNHNLIPKKNDMAISDYNDLFRKENIYDVSKWRNIQYLGDLRNLCDHSKDREPTNDDVEELINGTSKIIKTVF